MDECVLSFVKHRLSFRQAGEYLRKPVLDIDINKCVKVFEHIESSSDSDDASQISNILIDKNDKPEKILTLKDYKRKLKAAGGHLKYIDNFTDCFKSVITEMGKENMSLVNDVSNEIETVQQVIKDTLEQQAKLQDINYEENSCKFNFQNISMPNCEEYISIEDDNNENTLSTYWKILEEGDQKDTYIKNDEYNFEKTHWLDRPPVSWEVIDAAVKKCELWLKKYFLSK